MVYVLRRTEKSLSAPNPEAIMAESSLSSQHIRPEIRNKQKACETLSLENVDHNRSQTNKFQKQSKRSFTNKSILTYD
jgi:hypothetical protein